MLYLFFFPQSYIFTFNSQTYISCITLLVTFRPRLLFPLCILAYIRSIFYKLSDCIPCKLWNILQKMRRQFFSFFMPLLHLQLYRGLCFMASMALRHSPCASAPVTALKLLSLPATHCLMVRYLVLQEYSLRHCSLAFTQSRRTDREPALPSLFTVSTESGVTKGKSWGQTGILTAPHTVIF